MGSPYAIIEAQLPVVGGIGGHDLLALEDPSGKIIGEIDGLATDSKGNAVSVGFSPSDTIKVYNFSEAVNFKPYENAVALVTGTQQQVMADWNAAISCGNAINAQNIPYPFGGLGSTNSNAVVSTLDDCMGITEPSIPGTGLTITPGVGTLLLTPTQINGIKSTYGITGSADTSNDSYVSSISTTSSYPTITTTNPNGTTSTDSFSAASNGDTISTLTNYSLADTIISQQVNDENSSGQINASISGTGDITNLNNSTITLAAGATATINGTGDNTTGGANSEAIFNNALNGTSQEELFSPTNNTSVTSEFQNYSGLNATGTLGSEILNFASGVSSADSEVIDYTGLPPWLHPSAIPHCATVA